MDINFEDLKKEFDAFAQSSCSTECSEEESVEEEGLIESVQKLMLAPANCGVYFSRLDIKVIGLAFEEDVQIRERKRMLRDILKAVTSKESLSELFEIIKSYTDEKLAFYNELIEKFPASKKIFEDKFEKAENFKKSLDKIVKEFEGVEDLTL